MQLAVYNGTITRFIADDKVVYQRMRWEIRLASDNCTVEHDVVRSMMWAGDHGDLFSCVHLNRECSFMGNPTIWPMPFRLVLLTEHKVFYCYATNAVYRCLAAVQLYPSCAFTSADCRCFQVSYSCQGIHLSLSVHHTALTDRNF